MCNGLTIKIKICFFVFILVGIHTRTYTQGIKYSLATQTSITHEKLQQGFLSVPDEYKLRNFWLWMNGVATKKSITQDLEAMKAKGFGGAILADNGAPTGPVGPTFMSGEWLQLFAHAVKEADRLGIELSINIQSGMGDPGNPNIQPDNGMKKIVYSEIKVAGPLKMQKELPVPRSPIYYKDITVQAFRNDTLNNGARTNIKNWNIKSMNAEVPWKTEDDKYDMHLFYEDYQDSMQYNSIDQKNIINLDNDFSEGILTWNVP